MDFPQRNAGIYRFIFLRMRGITGKVDDDLVEVTSDGIQIYYREILKKGQNYQICAVYEKGSTGIYSFFL